MVRENGLRCTREVVVPENPTRDWLAFCWQHNEIIYRYIARQIERDAEIRRSFRKGGAS